MIDIGMQTDESQEIGFDPEAEIARDVLRNVLGDSFSREDEEFHAAAWEAQTGRPLKLAWESWTEYAARKKEFVQPKRGRAYFSDPFSATERLNHLLEKARTGAKLFPVEMNEIHELERLLGRNPTDFKKPIAPAADADAVSLTRYKRIRELLTWEERVGLVNKEKDIGALHLVILRDDREEVRNAARDRVMALEMASS